MGAACALFERHRDHDVKAILNLGAGVDSLLDNPALPDDVPVLKLSDAGMASHMLDYVRYGLLHFRRDFDRYARQQADTQWAPHRVVRAHQYPVAVLGSAPSAARSPNHWRQTAIRYMASAAAPTRCRA